MDDRIEEESYRRRPEIAEASKPEPRAPRIPLFESGQPELAERADELLEGFGDDGRSVSPDPDTAG